MAPNPAISAELPLAPSLPTQKSTEYPGKFVLLIWTLFVLKGVFYCVLFPMWEGFDEYEHYAFIRFVENQHDLPVPESNVSTEIDQSLKLVPLPWLLREWRSPHVTHDEYWQLPPQERRVREQDLLRLPVSSRAVTDNSLYEGQQGPLYYWLMTPLDWLMQGASLPSRVFLLRVVNVLLASLIIPIAFACGRIFFRDEYAALATCALLAVMPQLYIDTSRVGNQTLATILYAALTLVCLAALNGKPKYLLIGTVLGLLLLSKSYAVAAIPAVAFVMIWLVLRSKNPRRSLYFSAASVACAGIVAGWWYLRNLRLVGTMVWLVAFPKRPHGLSDFVHYVPQVDWMTALKSTAASDLWFGNWSFLTVRSWMYQVLEALILLVLAGAVVMTVRSLRSRADTLPLPYIVTVALMFGGFLAALAYHVLVIFMNTGIPATCGWYLYAVVLPEALLLITGVMAFGKWGRRLLLVLMGSFAALELYATHWLLIPYYTGLISHTPAGALQSFHPARVAITFTEILGRLHMNRPPFVTSEVVFVLWLLYLVSVVGVYYIAVRISARIRLWRAEGASL
jgi:hypothetical protein